MVDYVKVIFNLVPNAKIDLKKRNPDYDDIIWLDDREKPSREECDLRWETLKIEMSNDYAKDARKRAFTEEADPLFFGFQRGENTEQDWLDKIEEIRARYPYV